MNSVSSSANRSARNAFHNYGPLISPAFMVVKTEPGIMVTLGDRKIQWRPGMTLADLIDQVEEGRFYAVVRLNGRLVSRPYFITTQVPDGSEVLPLPLVAGG